MSTLQMTLPDSERTIAGKTHSEILAMYTTQRSRWYKTISPKEKEEAMRIVGIAGRDKISTANTGRTFTKEHKANISASKMGHTRSKESCAKQSATITGRIFTEEHKTKISESLIGRIFSEEHKTKLSKAMTGKIRSKEARAKQGATISGESHHMYGKSRSEATKLKISAAMTGKMTSKNNPFFGKTHSEETRAKISTSAVERYKDSEYRAKISAAAIERWKDPEYRDIHSGENNARWKDGASFLPYCPAFNKELKEHIRNLCDRTCTACGISTLQNTNKDGKWLGRLAVDHLDENKMQGCEDWAWRLTVLCSHCHGRMNRQENHTLLQLLLLNNKGHQTNFLFRTHIPSFSRIKKEFLIVTGGHGG